jgi:D-inositol-3-phosphate glycosyltransferase
MTTGARLSICFAAPGQNLLQWAGPTRNVLSVAAALSRWANVTVAFRAIPQPLDTSKYRVIAIDPCAAGSAIDEDDNATRGIHPFRHLSYCRTLFRFAREQARSFDIVLEKGWRLSGLLCFAFRQNGVPGILIENDVRLWTEPVDNLRQLSKYVLHGAADAVASSCSRRVSAIIAETPELKARLISHRKISRDRVQVVGLGVDHALFHPMDQGSARQALGIRAEVTVLLYVGAMDEYHDLEPVIDALGSMGPCQIELHVVGGGEYRARCEARAKEASVAARFHGQVPHTSVPQYVAAADLCLSPYRTRAFHEGVVTFSTLKIPEYMACARAVVGVPSAPIRRLIADRTSGFLIPNDQSSWASLLETLPSREQLAAMGAAARRATESITWDRTAEHYLKQCDGLITRADRNRARPMVDPTIVTR